MRFFAVLCILTLSMAAAAVSPINCAKAKSPAEQTICNTPLLLQADARMTTYFEIAVHFVAMGERGSLYDSQKSFPAKREACGSNKTCILSIYKQQTEPLERIIDRVRMHGPF